MNVQSGAIYAVYDDLSRNASRVQEVDPVALTVIRDRAINGFPPKALAVSPDGERIYGSAPAGVDVMQVDIAKMAPAAIVPLHVAEISGFVMVPGKGHLSTAQ